MITQAVVSLEVDIGISPIDPHCLIVGLRFSFVNLMSFLVATSEDAAPRSEFLHRLHRQSRSSMMLCFNTMDFVDRDCGIHDFWLDDLLVNHRLDVLMNY